MKVLRQFPELAELHLQFRPFDTNDHFQDFVAPPKLRGIHLESDILSERDAICLQKIPTLQTLSLSSRPGMTNAKPAGPKSHFGPLASAPALRTLSFFGFVFQPGDLASLSHQQTLERLTISTCGGITDQDLMSVSDFPNLLVLSITYIPIDGTGLQTLLEGAPKLELLDLSFSHITDDGLAVINHNGRNLSNLNLASTWITDAGREHWANLVRLGAIDLSNTSVSDLTAKELSQLPQLSWLNLKGTQITELGVVDLANLPKLEILNLDQTAVTGEGLRAFINHPSLKEIRISIALAGSPGLMALVAAKPELKVYFEPIPAPAPPILPPLGATPPAGAKPTAPKGSSLPVQ